ncbi:hypothetical protein GCM10023195_01310 [Actinoallomurus liliacearum]|uniref:Uncharacterized protein n=1 Tax=Actinoallomurus liliacearum TaxID=1080073 RepID=A0ABP8TCM6_9ACTN
MITRCTVMPQEVKNVSRATFHLIARTRAEGVRVMPAPASDAAGWEVVDGADSAPGGAYQSLAGSAAAIITATARSVERWKRMRPGYAGGVSAFSGRGKEASRRSTAGMSPDTVT